MKSIAVFCASSMGSNPEFEQASKSTGQLLAKNGIRLVYGGAQVGLMGALANGALEAGGEVIGVLPNFLGSKEIAHRGLTSLVMVDSMHERKQKMSDYADGVITLPGGFGTMEELFEFITWAQLGLHSKPIGLLNVSGYYNALIQMLDDMVNFGLLKPINRKMLLVAEDPQTLLEMMKNYQGPAVPKLINKDRT